MNFFNVFKYRPFLNSLPIQCTVHRIPVVHYETGCILKSVFNKKCVGWIMVCLLVIVPPPLFFSGAKRVNINYHFYPQE